MNKPRKLIVIKADGTVELIDRAKEKEEYTQFSKLVDGLIEPVMVLVPMTNCKIIKRKGYVNEEGLIKRFSINRAATKMYQHSTIVGTLIVMLNKDDDADLELIRKLFEGRLSPIAGPAHRAA